MGKFSKILEKAGYQDDIDQSRNGDLVDSHDAESIEKNSSYKADNKNETTIKEEFVKLSNTSKVEANNLSAAAGPWDARLSKAVHEDRTMPEIFSSLRSRILHPVDSRPVPKTIMVTSAIPGEGKSFVCSNLGVSLAHGMDQHALLVDCDLRKPTMASLFGLKNARGLVDYLRDTSSLPDLLCKTEINKLSILPSGKPPLNPSELLSSQRMLDLVEELSGRYEDRAIIFDTPPMLAAAESRVLAKKVDGVVLVVRQGKARKHQIQRIIETIPKDRILGVVFNDYKVNYIEKSYMSGYGYYRREGDVY